MTVVAVVRDLILASRIEGATLAASGTFHRFDSIDDLPPASDVSLAFVDWSGRETDWGERLLRWREQAPAARGPRLVLFGFHTDLEAHAAARRDGIGPMIARSKLLADLPRLIRAAVTPSR